MAEEREFKGTWYVRPKIASLHVLETEASLFESREKIENWKLADKSRRCLIDSISLFSVRVPWSIPVVPKAKRERLFIRQKGIVGAAAIVVRSIGSGMAQIACGYVAEAGGAMRRAAEARLNARAILDDLSGDYAIRYLNGHTRGLTKLAGEYGETVAGISALTHGSIHGLGGLLMPEEGIYGWHLDLLPARRPDPPGDPAALALYLFALGAIDTCETVANAFEERFAVPSWIGAELQRLSQKYGVDYTLKDPGEL